VQRRILAVALIAVALAVTLLGAPLAFVQRQYLVTEQQSVLDGEAARLALSVGRDLDEGRDPAIPEDAPADMHLAIYDGGGTLITGLGPSDGDDVVRGAGEKQHPVDGFTENDLVAAIPVVHDGGVAAVVRASSPRAVLLRHQLLTVAAVGGAAVLAATLAMLLALRLAWRLASPIKELTLAAEELGDGNFAIRAATSGIGELDAVAASLNATAQRLGDLVERERAFVSHASHQLRTPLTALRLRLDSALRDPDRAGRMTVEARDLIDDLEATVEDLLAVSRGRTAAIAALDLDTLLSGLPPRWEALFAAEGRRLVVRVDDPPIGTGRVATVRQVLDVLLDNAYRHGGGTVEVVARDASGALAIDVADEGREGAADRVNARLNSIGAPNGTGSTTGPQPVTPAGAAGRGGATRRRGGTGIGLGLARSLVVADGGRLLLSSVPGRTCATVLLPPAEPTEPSTPEERGESIGPTGWSDPAGRGAPEERAGSGTPTGG
jgi:signal transduction histidine kinase